MFDLPTEEALKRYQEFGGIVKFENSKLLYPNKERLENQLQEFTEKKRYLDIQIKELQRRNMSLSYDNVISGALRFADPLFWRHTIRKMTDQDYREASRLLEPPVNRLTDQKSRVLMQRFLEDDQYRRSLVESRTGILGKNRDTISGSIRKSMDYSRSLTSNRIGKLESEREGFDERIKILNSMLKLFEESNSETE